jgi:formamidopyrimidine-DNA glycosylase
MPELPEVETITRALQNGGRGGRTVRDRQIKGVDLLWPKTLAQPSLQNLQMGLIGNKISDITRRGKYICLQIGGNYLLVHLRMSGDLRVDEPPLAPYLPHDRFILQFEDGGRLAFNDARKFGRIWFNKSTETLFDKIGFEPFDKSLTIEKFHEQLTHKKRIIKSLLLDQSFVCGLGNIYTDESLHLAGIHPLRIASSLNISESEKLLISIRYTLQKGIDNNGASIDWVYRGGEFQNNFRVYQKTGQPCLVCGNIIERIVVAQRGTHFCPDCQPERAGR